MTCWTGSGGENARRPGWGGRRWAAVVAGVLVAVLCAGGVVTAPAQAAGPAQAVDPVQAAAPINHIFLSYHGAPSYTWTVRLVSNAGREVSADSKTCIGGCRESFPYDPASIGAAYI